MTPSLKEEHTTVVELGVDVLGISSDTIESHALLFSSLGLCPFPIASDQDQGIAQTYETVDGRGDAGSALCTFWARKAP